MVFIVLLSLILKYLVINHQAIDWKKGPTIHSVATITVPKYESYSLDNGIKVDEINMGTQEVMRIEVIYKGSRLFETKKLTAKSCAALMREGCANYNSASLAEALDFYGASMRSGSNLDYSYFSLSFITKYTEPLLALLSEVLFNASFPEKEFVKFQDNLLQKLQLDLSKNELMSYRYLTEILYGDNHIYGYNTEEPDIKSLTNEDIKDFYQRGFGNNVCFIVAAGKIPSNFAKKLNQYLGQVNKTSPNIMFASPTVKQGNKENYYKSKNEFQCSIKMGKRTFNRHHKDYTAFFVMNTIFGGYFGSRLMSSIREDLGYTYNIYSLSDHMVYDGYFYIDTETDPKYLVKTKEEIYRQMALMRNQEIEDSEMTMVKNYIMGNFLNLVDGPFNVGNLIRTFEIDGIDIVVFNQFIEELKSINKKDVLEMANLYLNQEDFIEVVVGP